MLIGHKRIWNFLTKSANNGRLAHAYLFVGSEKIGKRTLALKFAQWMLCKDKINDFACGKCRSCVDIEKNQNPDVFVLRPREEEKKEVTKTFEIGIDEIKALQHQLSLFAYGDSFKVAIIDGVDFLTREAANSFLKTLEEPRKRTLIILISSDWQAILPTIISRCQLLKFLPIAEKEIIEGLSVLAKNDSRLKKIVRLSANRPGYAIDLIGKPEIQTEHEENVETFRKFFKADLIWRWELAKRLSQNTAVGREFLLQWSLWLRDRILQNQGLEDLTNDSSVAGTKSLAQASLVNMIREIQRVQIILSNSSLNSRLALETLMIKI